MQLRLRDVKSRGVLDLKEPIPPAKVELSTPDRPKLVRPVEVKLHAELQGEEVWMEVEANARIEIACARCLDRFTIDLAPSFEIRAPLSAETVNVAEEVRQQLLLALPAKPLCRPDCRGICPRCGANWNTGPCGCPKAGPPSAFEGLKKLKLKR